MKRRVLETSNAGALRRPVGRVGLTLLVLMIATAPAVLFFNPEAFRPGTMGHIPREPVGSYRLFSDDVAYVSGSRTWERTVSNLFVPHNTHIVPAWRLLTWGLVAWAGKLERVPEVLAPVSYAILVAVMLLTGRLVARETRRTGPGLAAMALVGTTSLMVTPAMWYSAGQPLWAGFAILATLWYAQSYRRTGGWPALALAAISAPLAGWFWTIGHLSGPVAAVYLWTDGRRRCRLAAAVPLAASLLAVALSLVLGLSRMDSTVSFHGRTALEAVRPLQGIFHTAQSIPENLIFGNLGLVAHTTPVQGVVLTLVLFAFWVGWRWRPFARPRSDGPVAESSTRSGPISFPFNPLECAGATLVVGSYLIEWAFRGYLDFNFLRTINLRAIVPWYDAIPQIGAVLFAAGWWSGVRGGDPRPSAPPRAIPVTRWGALGLGALLIALIVLNRPRVEVLVRASVPSLLPSERQLFRIDRLQTMRANGILLTQTEWQRTSLRRLDRAQEQARRMGIGRDAIRAAFGHTLLAGTFGRIPPTNLLELYDAAAMLDLPEKGRAVDPAVVRAALGIFFREDPEPRPEWLAPKEPWPPDEPVGGGQ